MADEAGIGPPAGLLHLPAGFPADTADAFAVVGGARLELHSQVLATQANVLRDVFVTRLEGGAREEVSGGLKRQGLLRLLPRLLSCSSASASTLPALAITGCAGPSGPLPALRGPPAGGGVAAAALAVPAAAGHAC